MNGRNKIRGGIHEWTKQDPWWYTIHEWRKQDPFVGIHKRMKEDPWWYS